MSEALKRLVHYSAEPLVSVQTVEQEFDLSRGSGKPRGLWVSVQGEDDWPSWCQAEEFQIDRLAYAQRILLVPTARILLLSSAAELDAFDREHGFAPLEGLATFRSIRWDAVAERYQGIVIAPYIWERRLHRLCRWYYGWDCASGCIWDAAAVAEIVDAPELAHRANQFVEELPA